MYVTRSHHHLLLLLLLLDTAVVGGEIGRAPRSGSGGGERLRESLSRWSVEEMMPVGGIGHSRGGIWKDKHGRTNMGDKIIVKGWSITKNDERRGSHQNTA